MSTPMRDDATTCTDLQAKLAPWLGPGLALCGLLIVVLQFRLIAPLEYAWGLSLWAYLPVPAALGLALGVVLWLVAPLRRALVAGAVARAAGLGASARRWILGAGCVGLPLLLYLLRERLAFGDSRIIYWSMNADPAVFFFPDIGATFFMQVGYRLGEALGVGGLAVVQGFIALCGLLTVVLFVRVGGALVETPPALALLLGLVLVNGAARTFAGHIEVYGFVLASLGAFLLSSVLHLRGQVGWVWPALAFGLGLWVHIQYLFLIPSLLIVLSEAPALRGASPGRHLARWSAAAAVVFAPTLLFFAALLVVGHAQDLVAAVEKMGRWSEVGATEGHEAWIRPFGSAGAGTRYVLFSGPHLKYLANSFFLLTPFTLPLLAFAALSPRRLWDTPIARFLSSACATSLLYAAIVRPVYGPYDWDLFSLTGALLATLVGYVLGRCLSDERLSDLAALVIGLALLTTAVPLVAIGISARPDQGPFSVDMVERRPGEAFDETFERNLGPWL